ncbi:hypothetical protein EKD16_17945 [Streptomonospora litoralis]|uniref:Cytotoxic translational repressor of toxin-antitoxin stability system n=1 Tax=Streptomonospora litoralis TaxID=2498135 RepID=A0A4P6Q458_9ACTN|nr:hypothetical protein EKD16_17945 [Streptomonospora litoralis]
MGSRDRDRVPPPSVHKEWDLRFGKNDAKKGWEELCRCAPGNTRRAFEDIRSEPCPEPQRQRQHRLRGRLSTYRINGEPHPLWCYEVTGGGRVFYCVVEAKRLVWLIHAGPGHPKVTD